MKCCPRRTGDLRLQQVRPALAPEGIEGMSWSPKPIAIGPQVPV